MSIRRPSRRCLNRAPPWAAATVLRLDFHGRPARPGTAALGRGVPALHDYLHACLDQVREAAPELAELCDLARAAVDRDADDRAVNAAAAGLPGFAAMVPGRVVWLAAMVGSAEEAGAAAMLANDLAAVGMTLPLRAWDAALSDRSRDF
jgi:hypothetical protein